VEELLSRESGTAQACREYNVCTSVLYHWKEMYSRGGFDNEHTEGSAVKHRVAKLGRLVGKVTLENELLRRGLQNSLIIFDLNQASV